MRGSEGADWEALREEYLAGGISQRALARKRGVSRHALEQRAADEGWTARRAALGNGPTPAARAKGEPEAAQAGGGDISARLREKLLRRLEKVADAMPDGAVTELKAAGEDGATTLFKLRDLTAAYKDLAEGPAGRGDGDVEDLSALAEMLNGE